MSFNLKYLHHYFHQWDEGHAAPSLEILRGFVASIERDVENSITEFQTAEFETEILDLDEDRSPQIVRFFRGLDDVSWDFDELFLKHYPSMRRSSALLSIYASLEDEINLLCLNAQKHKKYDIGFKDLHGTGLERATNYLTKVCGLQGIKNDASWDELKKIGQLRNKMAHTDGKIRKDDEIMKYVELRKDLSTASIYRLYEDTRINLEKGYLEHVLDTVSAFFHHLGGMMRGVNWD